MEKKINPRTVLANRYIILYKRVRENNLSKLCPLVGILYIHKK